MTYAEDAVSLAHPMTQTPWEESSITKLFLFLGDSHQVLVRRPWRATQKGFTRRRRALMHWQSSRDRALCNLRREEYCGVFTAQGNIKRYFFILLLVCWVCFFLSVSYCWKGVTRKYLYSCSIQDTVFVHTKTILFYRKTTKLCKAQHKSHIGSIVLSS